MRTARGEENLTIYFPRRRYEIRDDVLFPLSLALSLSSLSLSMYIVVLSQTTAFVL